MALTKSFCSWLVVLFIALGSLGGNNNNNNKPALGGGGRPSDQDVLECLRKEGVENAALELSQRLLWKQGATSNNNNNDTTSNNSDDDGTGSSSSSSSSSGITTSRDAAASPKKKNSHNNHHNYCIGDNLWKDDCCSTNHCELIGNSTLASLCCSKTTRGGTAKWPLLITGTPRSGTVFVSNLFNSLSNISINNDWGIPSASGAASWVHLFADDNYYLNNVRNIGNNRFATIVHQVRDPLKSITSIAFAEPIYNPEYRDYIARHVPITTVITGDRRRARSMPDNLKIRFTLEFYLGWHRFLNKLNVPLVRLEDLTQNANVAQQLLDWAGLSSGDAHKQEIENFLRTAQEKKPAKVTNQREHRSTLQWEELCKVDANLSNQFWKLSQEFGYYMDITNKPCDGQQQQSKSK